MLRKFVFFVFVFLLILQYNLNSFSLTITGSINFEKISTSEVTTVAVDTINNVLVFGTIDGAILELDLKTLKSSVLAPASHLNEIFGGDWAQIKGLAVSSEFESIYTSAVHPIFESDISVLRHYERSGKYLTSLGLSCCQNFEGLFYYNGVLHLLDLGLRKIISVPVMENGHPTLPPQISINLGTFDFSMWNVKKLTGLIFLPTSELFLVSSNNSFLFSVKKGNASYPNIFDTVVDQVMNLRTLGKESIADLAFDKNSNFLYVVDSIQKKIFQISFKSLFHRGDPNSDGVSDVSDAVSLLTYLFLGGTSPLCMESADVNNDGQVEISDAIFLLSFVFLGDAMPPDPGPTGLPCGTDPAGEDSPGFLGCIFYDRC